MIYPYELCAQVYKVIFGVVSQDDSWSQVVQYVVGFSDKIHEYVAQELDHLRSQRSGHLVTLDYLGGADFLPEGVELLSLNKRTLERRCLEASKTT